MQESNIDKLEKEAKNQIIQKLFPKILNCNSQKEKYKIIFDYIVENFKYKYSVLYKIELNKILINPEYLKYLTKYQNKCNKNYKLDYKFIVNFLKYLQTLIKNNNDKIEFCDEIIDKNTAQELINYSKTYIDYYSKYKAEKIKEESQENNTSIWISKCGACLELSQIFLNLCSSFNLPCEVVNGSMSFKEKNILHAWNAIIIEDELKFVDISSAIHCADKTDVDHKKDDFFNKNQSELEKIDSIKSLKKRNISNNERIQDFLVDYAIQRLSRIYRMSVFYENKSQNSLRLQMLHIAKKILKDEKTAKELIGKYDFDEFPQRRKKYL